MYLCLSPQTSDSLTYVTLQCCFHSSDIDMVGAVEVHFAISRIIELEYIFLTHSNIFQLQAPQAMSINS